MKEKEIEIKIKITHCHSCPFWERGERQSTDGFDEGFDWFCTHSKVKRKKIAGFVEWHEVDKIEIPRWCPAKIKSK